MEKQSPFYKTGISRSPFNQEISGKENRKVKKAAKKTAKAYFKAEDAEKSVGKKKERLQKSSDRKVEKATKILAPMSDKQKEQAGEIYLKRGMREFNKRAKKNS